MKTATKRAAAVLILLLVMLVAGAGRAQPPAPPLPPRDDGTQPPPPVAEPSDTPSPGDSSGEPPPTFRLEEARILIVDKFKRPYLVPRETARLQVRLDMAEDRNPAAKDYQALAASGVEYAVKEEADYVDADCQTFPLVDGLAKVQFVVFEDAEKNPLQYRLAMQVKQKGSWVSVPLTNTQWTAGAGPAPAQTRLATTTRAPNQKWEWASLISFVLISLILSYILYGRSLFARMLYNRKLEVSSALGYSNLLILLTFALVLVGGFVLYFFPKILWNKQYAIYLLVSGGCLATLLAGYGAGLAMTRET